MRYSLDGFNDNENPTPKEANEMPSKSSVRQAISGMKSDVCITFEEVQNPTTYDLKMRGPHYDSGSNNGINTEGPNSHIGRTDDHVINLPKGCSVGCIQHELLHALGIDHEMSRMDRNNYVDVHLQVIKPHHQHNFAKMTKTKNSNFQTPFDHISIMNYRGDKSSMAKASRYNTITVKVNGKPTDFTTIGQRKFISSMDIYEVCRLYECAKCANQTIPNADYKDRNGEASYKRLMKKCSVQRHGVDQYYWLSRCRDGVTECLPMKNETLKRVDNTKFYVAEDESPGNANCDLFAPAMLKNHLAGILDCSDFTKCSATCGSGTQTCTRTCANGNFGETGCPNDEQINTQTCNRQQCRNYF